MEYRMPMKQPAAWWSNQYREGMPLGNGMTGALVYGGAVFEKVMLTHTYCWREGYVPEMPDVSDCLPKMRELIAAGRVPEADRILVDALLERGYHPREATPFPIADLRIETPAVEGFTHYRRELDMLRAQAKVQYEDAGVHYSRRYFVSRKRDLFVMEIAADGSLEDVKIDVRVHENELIGKSVKLPENARKVQLDEECVGFSASVEDAPFGLLMRVVRTQKNILILAKVFPDGDPEAIWPVLAAELKEVPADYDALHSEHEILHRELFEKSLFRLEDDKQDRLSDNRMLLDEAYETGECPNALTERMWAYGRYLLISSSVPGGLPCALMGLWAGEYRAGWAFNMANINLEMIYWQATGGNLTDLMLPVFDYYDGKMPGMRENAKKVYGCSGIYLPAVSVPGDGKMTCIYPHIVNWTGGAAWIAQHYYDYWLYTRDEEFLKNRLYPFLRETAMFYRDFLVWEGEKWHVIPSVSPENHTGSYRGGEELPDPMQTAVDATMDIALVREVMTNLLRIAPVCGAPEEEMKEWKRILAGSPAYQVDEEGVVREWNHPDFPDRDQHRHQSHIYPMFPGREHARKGTEPFVRGTHRRLKKGFSHQTSWSLMNMSCCFSRARDGKMALRCLDLTSRGMLMGNLFTVHNDWRGMGIGLNENWAPFQIDANMGWTAAVQEMLIYSDEEYLEVYPALPERWKKGEMTGMLTRCGVQVSLRWDEQKKTASLLALCVTEFTLCAGEAERRVAMKKGETISLSL